MLWNHGLHIVAGILGVNIFIWSGSGVLASVILVSITQAIDIVRMYFYHRNRILAAPAEVREEQMMNFKQGAIYKFAQLYIAKVIWYGLVTLVAAQIMRSMSA